MVNKTYLFSVRLNAATPVACVSLLFILPYRAFTAATLAARMTTPFRFPHSTPRQRLLA